jgi:hypothetical protein
MADGGSAPAPLPDAPAPGTTYRLSILQTESARKRSFWQPPAPERMACIPTSRGTCVLIARRHVEPAGKPA